MSFYFLTFILMTFLLVIQTNSVYGYRKRGRMRGCNHKLKVAGRCKASIEAFSFDKKYQKCVNFTYGGCPTKYRGRPNKNRFDTMDECVKKCKPHNQNQSSGPQIYIIPDRPKIGYVIAKLKSKNLKHTCAYA
jgi:hypothetical protein